MGRILHRDFSNEVRLDRAFSPKLKNKSQKLAWKLWPECDIMFLIGQAGCGKTHAAAALGMREIFEGRASKIFAVRPAVGAAGENLGYIPGELNDKMRPFTVPITEEIDKLCTTYSLSHPVVEVVPISYMRGRNLDDCVILIDEAQNLNKKQFDLAFSRMCRHAKIVVTGDPMQVDIERSFLSKAASSIEDLDRIEVIEFDEVENLRHELVPQVLARFDAAERD